MAIFTVDPNVFIRAPFRDCPSCGRTGSLGVLSVHDYDYTRRCRECRYTQNTQLPPTPTRKVVYLDQFVVSELMKARAARSAGSAGTRTDAFWFRLDERLTRLVLLQLAAFPGSSFHDRETTVARERDAIHAVYAALAGGVTFDHHSRIQHRQFHRAAAAWTLDGEASGSRPDRTDAMDGELDAWQDVIVVGVGLTDLLADEFRASRDLTAKVLQPHPEGLAKSGRSFDDLAEHEAQAYGETVIHQLAVDLSKHAAIAAGALTPTLEDLLPSWAWHIFVAIQGGLRKAGLGEDDLLPKAVEFLRSRALEQVPFVHVSSLLYAALIRKIASGQSNVPASTATDFEMIATLLPYCDAMFLDRQCHALLTENPLSTKVGAYGTKLFSRRNEEEFLHYLEKIETSAPREHLDLVREVVRSSL